MLLYRNSTLPAVLICKRERGKGKGKREKGKGKRWILSGVMGLRFVWSSGYCEVSIKALVVGRISREYASGVIRHQCRRLLRFNFIGFRQTGDHFDIKTIRKSGLYLALFKGLRRYLHLDKMFF